MADVTLTLAEAAAILDPPITEQQLRLMVRALGWKPDGHRYTGTPGNPAGTWSWTRLLALHEAHVSLQRQ